MSDVGWTAIAALGTAGLTAAASLGVVWLQNHFAAKAHADSELVGAVLKLMTRSVSISTRAGALGEAMKLRSGLTEGFDVALHVRKPADVMELHDWMHQDFAPMHLALAQIWSAGDQTLINAANEVVSACTELLGANTAREGIEGAPSRFRRWALGERWTDEMKAANERAVRSVAEARKVLNQVTRTRFGNEAVDVFAH